MGLKLTISKPNIETIYKKNETFFSQIYTEICNNKSEKIGFVEYNIVSGQICFFYIDEKYRNIGIGKKILLEIINELKENNIQYVWLYDRENHPFWLNIGFNYIDKNLYRMEI